MLGQVIYEGQGQGLGRRVLPSQGQGPRMEAPFQESGKMLGVDFNNTGTYTAIARPDGMLQGEGQGIAMSREGDVVTWTGTGVGKMNQGGVVSWRGVLYFQTASPKFARLNSIAGVYEYEIEANGNQKGKIWEWK